MMVVDAQQRTGAEEQFSDSRALARFELLAQTIAGYRVAVVGGMGDRSYTDGAAIFLADLPEHLLRASVVVQAGLLAVGSFDPWVMARLMGRRTLCLRYLTLEGARVSEALKSILPTEIGPLLSQTYAGPAPANAGESFTRAASGKRNVPEAAEWLGTIRPMSMLRGNPMASDTSSAGQRSADHAASDEPDGEVETEGSRGPEIFAGAPARKTISQIMRKLLGRASGLGGANGAGEVLSVWGRGARPSGLNAKAMAAPADLGVKVDGPGVGRSYPEWDFRRRAYRPDWCTVAEFDPPRATADLPTSPARDPQLLRQLARLGLTPERHRRQPQGDTLDLTALVEWMAHCGAGFATDARVYEYKRRSAHDLGVLVLLDATGSTCGQQVFDQQLHLVARLTSALEELGDRVAAYGFFSRGRGAVRYLRVKDFDDRYDQAAQRRLASLAPEGFTRLGAAIRHGVHVLNTRAGTSHKLLVLVGDGFPYEDDYHDRYAQRDSRQALREAVAQGVGCVCVSVGPTTEETVTERVWREVPHRSLADASALARHVRPLFREAMRQAEASKRPIGSASAAHSTGPVRA
jgi:Mg-chelatase subunit ChlD